MLNSPKGAVPTGVSRGRLGSADTTASNASGGAIAGPHLNEEDLGKFRTKFCERKIIYGFCDHGGGWGCNFSHNLKWLRRNAQKQKYAPRLCATFPACVNGMSCQYAHSREEQFFHPSVYKRLPCMSFPQCRLGQLCPFTHGLGDHATSHQPQSEQLSPEDLYQVVDQQTSVILHTLNLTAEKLLSAVAELEMEHDPGVRTGAEVSGPAGCVSLSSPFQCIASQGALAPARVNRGSGSLLDVLSELASARSGAGGLQNSGSETGSGSLPFAALKPASDEMPSDRFITLLKSERGFLSHLLLGPGAVDDLENGFHPGRATTEGGNWKSICKDIVISVSSGKVGVYIGHACVAFEGRMDFSRSSSSGGFGGFEQPPCEEKSFKECLVVRCAKTPLLLSVTSGQATMVSPVRVDTDAKNGWVGIFEVDGRRTVADFLRLEKKLINSSSSSSSSSATSSGGCCLLEDNDGQLSGSGPDSIADFLVAVKEDRDLLVRQFILQMLRTVQNVHEAGRALGGFALDQWQFASGSVDKLLLLPVNLSTPTTSGSSSGSSSGGHNPSEDIRSLGLAVGQLLVGAREEQTEQGQGQGQGGWAWLLGAVAEQRGGLAWDFVARCLYRSEKETVADLQRHPFLWSWSTQASVLMRGVAGWFQQSGLLFKPNAQRHLINWAENSFGCTRNEGVPVRRQVFRLSATLDWTPGSSTAGVSATTAAANVVSTLPLGDKRASPCLVLEANKVSLVKAPVNSRSPTGSGRGEAVLNMLPVCSADSHLELLLPNSGKGNSGSKGNASGTKTGGGRLQQNSYSRVIDQLLARFQWNRASS